jgi:tetratricopeptide (TPR) repeat protein
VGDKALRRWEIAGLVALAVIVVTIPLSQLRRQPAAATGEDPAPAFVGSASCRDCHAVEWNRWLGSDHDRAMAEATDETVLGDFNDVEFTHHGVTSRFFRRDDGFYVWTEGPAGGMAEFEITHTFGHDPLQQYLVPFPGGRLQSLPIAWDTVRDRWFHLYPDQDIPPDDWLHWTRNAQNWNGMCAECHSTNLRKGYDSDSETYDTTWSDIDVGCEACHGPGSRHVAWASIQPMARPELAVAGLAVSTRQIEPARLVELCAPCHSRRAELGDYDHTGVNLLDHMLPSLLAEGLYWADGQILDEVYVYASFLQSKMYARDVTCSNCHDSHSLRLHYDGNELCLQCHQREVYDTSDHHFHKKVYQGKPSEGALCVKCHMVERPYMVIDWRADHSFRLPRPDLSVEIGTPNACNQGGCHDDKPLSWSVDAHKRWYGQARRPQYGTTFAAAWRGEPAAEGELVRLAENQLQSAVVRASALRLLERYPGDAATSTLRASLFSEDPLIRHTAAQSLTIPDPAERAKLLAPLLSDPVRAVRLASLSKLAGVPRELLKSYQQRAFDTTLEEYRTVMAYTLDFSSSGMNLGNLYAALGDADMAEQYYRSALKIDDLFYPAKMNLAVLLSGAGRNPEAEALLREVVRDYPDNLDAAYSLGLLLVEMGRPDEGVDWLRRAATGEPANSRALYNLGLLAQQLGRAEEAEQALTRALELQPTNLDFLYALADHYLKRGRFDRALVLAERMIAAHPEQQIGRDMKTYIERESD